MKEINKYVEILETDNDSEKKEPTFEKECKLVNLRYEYQGYTGNEKWAIVSALTEEEIYMKYPNEISEYAPFVLLTVKQGEAIWEFIRNEDKYRKRQVNTEDAFGYDEGITENIHLEISVPDFWEQEEINEYYRRRSEEKMRLFVTAMESLTEKQHKYLVMRYLDGKSARDIATEIGIAHQVVDRHISTAEKKVRKIFGDFFEK